MFFGFTGKVVKFNRLHPPPDVTREEWLSSFTQETYSGSSEVGLHPEKSNVEELLEKQAELIRYLRSHNDILSHRMMLLVSGQGVSSS